MPKRDVHTTSSQDAGPMSLESSSSQREMPYEWSCPKRNYTEDAIEDAAECLEGMREHKAQWSQHERESSQHERSNEPKRDDHKGTYSQL